MAKKKRKPWSKARIAKFIIKRNNSPIGQWRIRVLDRDKHTCQQCQEAGNVVHHIQPKGVYKDVICEDDNGVCLCAGCHDAIHRDKQRYNDRTGELIFFP